MIPEQARPNDSFDAPTWAPFRFGLFRLLWLAQLSAYIGIWMHTVAAQWVLVTQGSAVLLIALVQTAISIPMVLLILPAGALADVLDRKRLLIFAHSFQLVVATTLAYLALRHTLEPKLLLLLTFLLACGTATATPTWQALLFDLVPRTHIPSVAALNGVNINVARAIGPAIAGVLIAAVGTGRVFTVIALSFTIVLAALLTLKRGVIPKNATPGRLFPALSSGLRYVRHSREIVRGLMHASMFSLPAIGISALLPAVAHRQLGMSATGYGFLLSTLGIGAVIGAWTLTPIRSRIGDPRLLPLTSVGFAVSTLAVAVTNSTGVAAIASLFCGATWLITYAVLSGCIQLALPPWVRARGVSIFLFVVMLSQALGSVIWGFLSEISSPRVALLISVVVLMLAAFISFTWPLLIDASERTVD